MYLIKTPKIIQLLMPDYVWRVPNRPKKAYLTFDDGPIPNVTPWVLDTLSAFGTKATFFCVGENVARYPDIYKRILNEGHRTGNHTHNHLNGWKTPADVYLENVNQCAGHVKSSLFRPPYGRLTRAQKKGLLRAGYTIVLWDVLSADFDRSIAPQRCLQNVLRHTGDGSIIVLHDSLKAETNLRYVLPLLLSALKERGYALECLPDEA
jgi:peptidoglycan-N-acetylglucosamine deacetylase